MLDDSWNCTDQFTRKWEESKKKCNSVKRDFACFLSFFFSFSFLSTSSQFRYIEYIQIANFNTIVSLLFSFLFFSFLIICFFWCMCVRFFSFSIANRRRWHFCGLPVDENSMYILKLLIRFIWLNKLS